MSETRYIEEYDGNGSLVNKIPYEVSDGELAIEAVEAETREANDQALVAYQNFGSLSLTQKNRVLKALLGDFIIRNKGRYTDI